MTVSEGDRILANWLSDEYWYSAIITAIDEKIIHIIYDDGTNEELTIDRVLPFNLEKGTNIEGRWKGGPNYYRGLLIKIKGDAIRIAYDSGEKEWLPISLIRLRI